MLGVRLIISDACMGHLRALWSFVPDAVSRRALDQGPRDCRHAQGDPCRRGYYGGPGRGLSK